MPSKLGKQPKHKARETPGPKPEVLKIEGDWKDAIKKALGKKRPIGGWPQPKFSATR